MSKSAIEPALGEIADWQVFDANVRLGRSGVYADLALEAPELISEMDRFGIARALVSHFVAEEYDATEGNDALARDLRDRFEPAWAALSDEASIRDLSRRKPRGSPLVRGRETQFLAVVVVRGRTLRLSAGALHSGRGGSRRH